MTVTSARLNVTGLPLTVPRGSAYHDTKKSCALCFLVHTVNLLRGTTHDSKVTWLPSCISCWAFFTAVETNPATVWARCLLPLLSLLWILTTGASGDRVSSFSSEQGLLLVDSFTLSDLGNCCLEGQIRVELQFLTHLGISKAHHQPVSDHFFMMYPQCSAKACSAV